MPDQASLVRMVLARLERVSADSVLAHRASGVRGALIKSTEAAEMGGRLDPSAVDEILEIAFVILEQEAGRYSTRFGSSQRISA